MTTPHSPNDQGSSQQPYQQNPAQGYGPPAGYPQQPSYAGPPPQAPAPKKRKKWPFIVGGIIALIVIIAAANSGGSTSAPSTSASPASSTSAGGGGQEAAPAAAEGHTVTYQVSGPAKAGNVTYTKEGFQMEQVSEAKLPWSKDLTFKDDVSAFSGLSLVAQNGGSKGDITCKILVDGKEIASSTSSGAYAVVTCNGSNA